jgi:hypothetical protein
VEDSPSSRCRCFSSQDLSSNSAGYLPTVSTSTCPAWPSLLLPFLVLRCPIRSYSLSSPRLHVRVLTPSYFTVYNINKFGLHQTLLFFGSPLCNQNPAVAGLALPQG